MNVFEDLEGCLIPAIVVVILLILIVCVAVVIFGAAIPNLLGQGEIVVNRTDLSHDMKGMLWI